VQQFRKTKQSVTLARLLLIPLRNQSRFSLRHLDSRSTSEMSFLARTLRAPRTSCRLPAGLIQSQRSLSSSFGTDYPEDAAVKAGIDAPQPFKTRRLERALSFAYPGEASRISEQTRVLVTGSSGQIGCELLPILRKVVSLYQVVSLV
jgi:hypothetical protein